LPGVKAGFSGVEPCLYSKQSFKVGCFSARIVRTNNIFDALLQYFFLILINFYNLTPQSGPWSLLEKEFFAAGCGQIKGLCRRILSPANF
jgi:hypothetical protein